MNRLYRMWLSANLNGANAKIKALMDFYGGSEEVYKEKSYNDIKFLTPREKSKLQNKDTGKIEDIIEKTDKIGGKIILVGDKVYPKILRQIHRPPSVLYVKGSLPKTEDVLTIGVVGTRKLTDYGKQVTYRISAELAKAGTINVNGMALGADSIGAWAALENGGSVIGVIGNGLDIVYPNENDELYAAVIERGCIITEFPVGTPPIGRNFPIRNRVIAGLSRGVLVTEAPQKSGALITARYAMEEGRDVFAVPGNVADAKYDGTNTLIQQGAKLVMKSEDILSEYPYAKLLEAAELVIRKVADAGGDTKPPQEKIKEKEKPREKKSAEDITKNLTDKDKQIALLLLKKDMQIDEMARELDMPVGDLNTRLIMLEMKGTVAKLPGSYYKLKTD